nr:PREDICTED: leucine-rich repeat-containing G-protein coupled receptor 4-like isoform X1 [Tribolium castaneum]|eukprot:XP_015835991.1 PREDICTED: leucine-rich repeat-containing G-protein coupled receptor 4-like isoform X1 [Tribolium castaneum]
MRKLYSVTVIFILVKLFQSNAFSTFEELPANNFTNVAHLEFVEDLSQDSASNVSCRVNANNTICHLSKKHVVSINNNLMQKFRNIATLSVRWGPHDVVEIADDALNNLKNIKELSLKNCYIKSHVFKNASLLKILYVAQSTFESIQEDCFEGLPNLEELWISLSNVVIIRRGFFKNLPNLTALLLPENGIEGIEKNAISYTKNLAVLNLSHNRLTYLPDCFKSLAKLTILSLRNNLIKYLNWKDFRGLISLEYLDLSNNKMGSFDAKIIGTYFPNLRMLRLDGNVVTVQKIKHFSDQLQEMFNRSVVAYSAQ